MKTEIIVLGVSLLLTIIIVRVMYKVIFEMDDTTEEFDKKLGIDTESMNKFWKQKR